METPPVRVLCPPFSLLFAQKTIPTRDGDQTSGAETEAETSQDGVVRKDQEQDEDVDA